MEKDPWKELAERIVLASALAAVALYLATRRFGDLEYAEAFQFLNWLVAVAVALFALGFGEVAAWNFSHSSVNPWIRQPVAWVMGLAIGWFVVFGMIDAYWSLCAQQTSGICLSS